jgi:hypothetical protein
MECSCFGSFERYFPPGKPFLEEKKIPKVKGRPLNSGRTPRKRSRPTRKDKGKIEFPREEVGPN